MSNQDSGSRLSRLLSATKKSSDDSGFAKKGDDNEPKNTGIAGGGRGRLIQMAVSTTTENFIRRKKLRSAQLLLRI